MCEQQNTINRVSIDVEESVEQKRKQAERGRKGRGKRKKEGKKKIGKRMRRFEVM